MSINCWLIFQLDLPKDEVMSLLDAHLGREHFAKDRVVVLYEGHRYQTFTELSDEERETALELFLGDSILAHLKDPRGVCVQPEVGQSFEGLRYRQIVSNSGTLWVKCHADTSNVTSGSKREDSETAVEDILLWAATHDKAQVAHELMHLIMSGRWPELSRVLKTVPDLERHAAIFESASPRAKKRRAEVTVPHGLEDFVTSGVNLLSAEEHKGCRATGRIYVALRDEIIGDFFLPQFSRFLTKTSFSDPDNRIVILQMEVTRDLSRALNRYSKVFAKRMPEHERLQMKNTQAFSLAGRRNNSCIMLKYYGDDETSRALVTVIALFER